MLPEDMLAVAAKVGQSLHGGHSQPNNYWYSQVSVRQAHQSSYWMKWLQLSSFRMPTPFRSSKTATDFSRLTSFIRWLKNSGEIWYGSIIICCTCTPCTPRQCAHRIIKRRGGP